MVMLCIASLLVFVGSAFLLFRLVFSVPTVGLRFMMGERSKEVAVVLLPFLVFSLLELISLIVFLVTLIKLL